MPDYSDKDLRVHSPRTVFVFLTLAFIYAILFILFSDILRIITIISDDSCYFLKIAENLADGKGFTFDGINYTNGFQPLWLYLLAGLQAIVDGRPEIMLRLSAVIQAVLLFLSGILFYRVHSMAFSRKTGLVSAVAFLVFVFFSCLNGMESALLVLMLAVLFFTGWKVRIFQTGPGARHLLFGIVLGLTVLARLDAVFIAAALILYLAVDLIQSRSGVSDKIKRLGLITAGSALAIAPYLFSNLIATKSVMPISGSLKSTFPMLSKSGYGLSRLSVRDWGKISAATIYLAWYFSSGRECKSSERKFYRGAVAVLGASVIFHFLHTVLFMKWAVFRWHFVTYNVLGTFVLSEPIEFILSRLPRRFVRAVWPVALTLLLVAGGMTIKKKIFKPYDWNVQSYEAALWVRANTGEEEVLAMKDSGIFGYFSERQVVNLDGVVSNRQFQEVLKNKELDKYLRNCNVRYIAQHAIWHRDDVVAGEYTVYVQEYLSRMYDGSGDSVDLTREAEVYRSPLYFDGAFDTVFLIWRYQQ